MAGPLSGGGEAALGDRSSRPRLSPRSIAPAKALAIAELRRTRLTQARIAASLGVSKSTVGRVLARAGLSKLRIWSQSSRSALRACGPGDLLHIDTKKLGRIVRPATGSPAIAATLRRRRLGVLFVAIDDHARIGFTDMYPDEKASAVQFLRNAVAYYERWASSQSACSPTTARPSAPTTSPKPA